MNREYILSKEPIMRLSLAFYYFIRNNRNWNNNIENTISSHFKKMSDYDFEFDKKLYSFYYQYLDNTNVRCCVKEYNTFFECAREYEYLLFDYNIENENIVRVHKNGLINLNG